LNRLGTRLKHKVQVSFVNQHGAEEAGIDGGGVFKEFLDDLIKDGFASSQSSDDTDQRSHIGAPPLFSVTPHQTLAINFDYINDPELLDHYEFLGRVLGKAVYESILVEPQFCLPFLNQLLGKTNSTEDLKNYDEEYYNNLNKLKGLSDSEIEALGLNFEVTVGGHTSRGSARTVELIPGGRYIPVKTKTHIFQYIHAVANQLLNVQGARQTKAFLRGFRDLIPASWVRLFSANELQNLISGDDSVRGIDVSSLKRATSYLGGYHESQPYIHDFWDIVEHELTPEQQRKFLRFMTSCSRQPLLGFGSLDPSPAIQQIRLEEEPSKSSKLPSSQTCFNLLKLPNYKSKALLRDKLLAAIESGAGFELT
jgi:ubiquitin-protein ligase E3 C